MAKRGFGGLVPAPRLEEEPRGKVGSYPSYDDLMEAARCDDSNTIRLQMATYRLDPNVMVGPWEISPLGCAVLLGCAKAVGMMVTLRAAPDMNAYKPTSDTALCLAVRTGDDDILRTLIRGGADVNRRNYYGETPLILAAKLGRTELARILLDSGADVDRADKEGTTPLFAAAVRGHEGVLRLLVREGADWTRGNYHYTSPHQWALARRDDPDFAPTEFEVSDLDIPGVAHRLGIIEESACDEPVDVGSTAEMIIEGTSYPRGVNVANLGSLSSGSKCHGNLRGHWKFYRTGALTCRVLCSRQGRPPVRIDERILTLAARPWRQ